MDIQDLHVVVIGAGIGGLAAGALLARKGMQVTVLEARDYPGGCAATFFSKGYRFDAGATVGCGFHPGGPMEALGWELGIVWPATSEPVAWQYRKTGCSIDLTPSRKEIISRFPRSEAFWKEQSMLAELLWHLSAGGLSWPAEKPRDFAMIVRKGLGGLPGTVQLLRFASRTALEWLAAHDLDSDPEFVRFIDAQLLISVQTTAQHANAINAAIALDLPVSGSWKIAGGLGRVSELLADAITKFGGAVLYRKDVVRIDSIRKDVLGVETLDGDALAADIVLANITPDSLALLTGMEPSAFDDASPPRWSAFMLYLGMDTSVFDSLTANHVQIVVPEGELGECGSIFVSASPAADTGRAPAGLRAVTVSTHTRPAPWFEARNNGRGAYLELKERYTRKVLDLLSEHLPESAEAIRTMTAATPVTWERYTGRFHGYVGGYPQTSLFDVRGPATAYSNMLLVGDSIFPGQSLPGVVTGARRVVELVLQRYARNGG